MNIIDFQNRLTDIVSNYPPDVDNNWIYDLYRPLKRNPDAIPCGDLLKDLFEYLDLSKLDAMGFWFSQKCVGDERYIYFGANDTNKIAIDKLNSEVVLIDADDTLLYVLAGNLSDYLSVFIAFSEYSIKGYYGYKFTEEDRVAFGKACKGMVKDKKFFGFYEEHFSVD